MPKHQKILIGCNSALQGDLYELVFRSIGLATGRSELTEVVREVGAQQPDILFLYADTIAPSLTEGIKRIVSRTRREPGFILLVTRSRRQAIRLAALDAGVDDVISEPTSLTVVLGRLRYFLAQRIASNEHHLIANRDIRIDLHNNAVRRGERAVHLTPTGFQILKLFLTKPEQLMSRDDLRINCWGVDANVDDRSIDVAVNRVRRALSEGAEADPIYSIRGEGYIFKY